MINHLTRATAGALFLGAITASALGLAAGTAYAFDPQPDPPRVPNHSSQYQSPGATVGFNPQPEPGYRPSVSISVGR